MRWQPDPLRYGFASKTDIPVRMDDGVTLRVDEYFPTASETGEQAAGRFPVLLEQTPYGKANGVGPFADYFVRRGYILIIADLRGFGKSQGQAAWFGERMGRDGAELVDWAAHLHEADGKLGLLGCSFPGVQQFFTAISLSPGSPVKAMAPFCVDSNFYRDLTVFGGIPTQFALTVRSVTSPGVDDDPSTDPFMQTIVSEATGDNAYYNDYWKSLNVTTFMPKIVSLGIPILTESGWRDIFPGGSLDAEVAAQNAFAGRPVAAPLLPGARLSQRYQTIVGDWTHGEHQGDTLLPILLSWFDLWLKDRDVQLWQTGKPLHLFMAGTGRWIDSASYPVGSDASTYFLKPGAAPDRGLLSADAGNGACPSTTQPMGCSRRLIWAPEGPGAALTFESRPLTSPLNIAGPGDVTLYIRSTRAEAELTATLFAVDQTGRAAKITNGALLGSQRALDRRTSWYSGGELIRPNHYFTKPMSSPVPVGQTVRIDIELLPAFVHVPVGFSLRLVLATQPAENFRQYGPAPGLPNLLAPTPSELAKLVGGVYTIFLGDERSSALRLATAQEGDLEPSAFDWGPVD